MFSGFFLALIAVRFSLSFALIASQDINPPYPKAISVSDEILRIFFFFVLLFYIHVSGITSMKLDIDLACNLIIQNKYMIFNG